VKLAPRVINGHKVGTMNLQILKIYLHLLTIRELQLTILQGKFGQSWGATVKLAPQVNFDHNLAPTNLQILKIY